MKKTCLQLSLIFTFVFAFFGFTQEDRDPALVTGRISERLLQTNRNFAWFPANYGNYNCNASAITQLAKLSNDIHFIAFGGTWNEASKIILPQFYKSLDEAKISRARVLLYFLDRDKHSPQGFENDFGISEVPTIIVMKGNTELGRIRGNPASAIEAELADILLH